MNDECFDNRKNGMNKNRNIISNLINCLKDISFFLKPFHYFMIDLDIKDNFLFEIVLQTDSKVIVTKEKPYLTLAKALYSSMT